MRICITTVQVQAVTVHKLFRSVRSRNMPCTYMLVGMLNPWLGETIRRSSKQAGSWRPPSLPPCILSLAAGEHLGSPHSADPLEADRSPR
jgi:hypothetical protein